MTMPTFAPPTSAPEPLCAVQPEPEGLREPTPDALAQAWGQRVAQARAHWDKFHQRVRHNRALVAGFDWNADPRTPTFYRHRANLIHGTITAVLPSIYARNPEISVTPMHKAPQLALFCNTLQTVLNRCMEQARLKDRAKATVRSALTSSFGVVKVLYQRDIKNDPLLQSRMQDTQDNLARVQHLLTQTQDPQQRGAHEARVLELEQALAALREQTEITAAEGLVIDRVLTENLLLDPSVCEFWDYRDADWMCQIVPMKKSQAEALYRLRLDGARAYQEPQAQPRKDGRLASAAGQGDDERQIALLEIWDRQTQRVYTLAEGCDFWLRAPYSPPKVGQRWFPFFLLPFQVVDGQVVGPSLVDLTARLQEEHNKARERYNQHRDLCLPGWIAGSDISERTIRRYSDSSLGEITLIDTEGKPLLQTIMPRQHPPIDPLVYDTSSVRYDWEQVTGLQDAARSTVVRPKTATEASIMQQSLSGRVSEFRDQVEDWLQEIAQYAAQMLLQEMTVAQVERIMGAPEVQQVPSPLGPMALPVRHYDWPQLTREQVYEAVEIRIRAGTTGAPDKLEAQENWSKVLPVAQGLVMQIMQARAAGLDAGPLIALLRETLKRFDERLEVEQFVPQPPSAPAPGALPAALDGPAPAL